MPNNAKKLLRKGHKMHSMSSLQQTNITQTTGLLFAERFELVKMKKFLLDLMKIVDCFLDDFGKNDSNLISFRMKSL